MNLKSLKLLVLLSFLKISLNAIKSLFFRLLDKQQTKEVFKLLSHSKQQEIINGLAVNVAKIARLLNDLEPDDRTAFLGELPGVVALKLIKELSPEQREITNLLLGYLKI